MERQRRSKATTPSPEKLARDISAIRRGADDLGTTEEQFMAEIESLISQALEEARMFERTETGMIINWKHGFDKGKAEAFEQCIKVAEDHSKDFKGNIQAELMALRIRDEISDLQEGLGG